MSDVIRLLPDSVANQIAAGEVIQRPASVIKELVENAVDAGADDIQIVVRDAGKTLIQVIDNGCGMTETDARLAFERHATSKIRGAEDLFALRTMGFRGEALPSICAISRVELRTKTADSDIGTKLIIEGSKVESQEICVCDQGSNFQVKNIFFNVPARRRFLSSDATELSNIVREFERMALANPNIRFRLDTGSRTIVLTSGSMLNRISELWKKNLKMQLIPVKVDLPILKIEGYISRPEFARRRNALQYLLVNGRNMRHPAFRNEILRCYENLIARDTQPCFFLSFTVDPSTIDVNIHPTKQDIKFQNEWDIRTVLSSAVKSALGKNAAMPSIDFSMAPLDVRPLKEGEKVSPPESGVDTNYNPFRQNKPHRLNTMKNWDRLYSDFMSASENNEDEKEREKIDVFDTSYTKTSDLMPIEEVDNSLPPMCIQCGNKYIATGSDKGIILIDAYRAQVKFLYEEFIKSASGKHPSVQRLVFPETVILDSPQQEALHVIEDDLRRLGIDIEYVEDSVWKILAFPPMMNSDSPAETFIAILDSMADEEQSPALENGIDRIALYMARASAIKGYRKMTETDMEHIVSKLFKLPDPAYTPDGKTIMVSIEGKRFENLFG